MRHIGRSLAISTLVVALAGWMAATAAEEAAEPAGKAAFLLHKCNLCHAVPAAAVEAKTKSEKMRASDLGGPIETDFETLAAFLRKEAPLDGEEHKQAFKGTDEELQTIVDWLAGLKPPKPSAAR